MRLKNFFVSKAALMHHGAKEEIADQVADAVAKSESVGNRICGLYYLESYCQQLVTGRVNGAVEPEVSKPKEAAVYVDARFGFAQPAFAKGLPDAVKQAQTFGVSTMSVGHAHACTSLGYFTEHIARAGLIGMGFTNASLIVVAPGGKTPSIGTNPIAFSVPDGHGGIAMQFDQSTTTVTFGKITMAKAAGEPIPEGWGFGLMAELLSAGLAGGVISRDVKLLKALEGPPHDLGQFYILIDLALSQAFYERLAQVTKAVARDEDARMPGQFKKPAVSVYIPEAL